MLGYCAAHKIIFARKDTKKISNMQEKSAFLCKKEEKSGKFNEKRDLGRENGGKNEKY